MQVINKMGCYSFCEDLRKDKKMKSVNCFMILFKILVFENCCHCYCDNIEVCVWFT